MAPGTCRLEGQVANIMCAIVCIYTEDSEKHDRLRKTSGNVNTHLGDGLVDDMYLIFAPLYLLFMTLRAHTVLRLKNKQFALKGEPPCAGGGGAGGAGSEVGAHSLALPFLHLVGYHGV